MTEIVTILLDANGKVTEDHDKAVKVIRTELDDEGNVIRESFLVPEGPEIHE